jgi:glycosyltransferase involved in cell wall biosynthesis
VSVRPLIVDLGRDDRGGQHQALLLLQGFQKLGYAPELIAVGDSLLASRAKEIGVPVHVVGAKRRRLTAALTIRKLVGKRAVDLIHANEPHALSSAWLAGAHRRVPLVASRRIALPLSKGYFSVARYRAAARIVAVSHFVEQSVLQSGFRADSVSVIYDGVEISAETSQAQRENARHRLGIPSDVPCIGNVAAFVPEKGHAMLLEAFAKLRVEFPECILLLRGKGPELSMLQSLARNLNVAGAVKYLSSSIDVETTFAAMDIFAFPSHEEPLGSALLAAMAHALPVVAIARGGIPEAVDHGKNGVLVNDLESGAFSSAVARLLGQPEEAARMGQAARETAIARFSANQMVDQTIRLYESLIAAGSRV